MSKKNIDFTTGKITKSLVLFALPIIAGQLFQNLYNSVDSIVVGQFVGKEALAATSTCVHITNILVGFFTGLSLGNGAMFARYVGAKDDKKLHDSIHTAMTFSIICGICLMIFGNVFADPLLKMINCPEEIFENAEAYLKIYTISCGFLAIYNTGSSILRAAGDSRTPFIYLVISSITNVVLDITLVTVVDLGVRGVALATVLSQLVSVILVLNKLIKEDSVYRLIIKDLKIDMEILKNVVAISIPSALQNCIVSFSNMTIQKYINGFGTDAIAGIGAAMKADKFVSMSVEAFESSLMTFVSQNYGAKKYERLPKGIKAGSIAVFCVVAFMGVICYAFSPYIVSIFNSDSNVISYGVLMMRSLIPFYPIMALFHALYGVFRGYGHSFATMVMSLSTIVGCRQIYLYFSQIYFPSVKSIVISYPICWCLALLVTVTYYFVKIRNKYPKA